MKRFLRDLPFFVEVARQKNFSRAADALDMPVSTLSRRIQALERELGTQLFFRSARKVELTDNGQLFYERCNSIVAEAESAWEELATSMKKPAGRVRVSMQGEVYYLYLIECINEFALHNPGIQIHLQFSDRWADFTSDPIDLDLRVGPLPDSSFRVRKLFTLRPSLYVSPKLLEVYPVPQKPEDLQKIPCIAMAQQNNAWILNNGKVQVSIPIKPAHTTNSAFACLELARAGLGVIWQIPIVMKELTKSGEFVRILPEWRHFDVNLNIVMGTGQIPQRVRLFVDHLVEHFARMQEREEA